MKLILVTLGLVAAAAAELRVSGYEPIEMYYHENYGVQEAARIKALESALDFDGSRIAGGSHASNGQFPFMAGLLMTVPQGRSVCGATLISNTRLMTAAHCWFDGRTQATLMTVVLGTTRIFSGGTRYDTRNVVMHPNWNHRVISNDVAVIRTRHFAFTNLIRAANVATGNNNFAGSTATAVGFGLKGDNVNIAPDQPLSHVNLQVISNAVCRTTFVQIQASNICTSGANGRSTCRGDSGGPLAMGTNVIGITSFGSAAGCTRGFPAAYARVTSFATWIRAQ